MGVFRSGTSLLSTALNTQSHIYIAWQPYFIFFKYCRNKYLREVIKKKHDENYPMGIWPLESHEKQSLFFNIFNSVFFKKNELDKMISDMAAHLSYSEKKMNQNMKPDNLINYLTNMESGSASYVLFQLMERLSRANSRHSGEVTGIKEVFCEEYIPPILNEKKFDKKIIHIIRDPRAIVASRNYGKYRDATNSIYSIYFIIRSWKSSVKQYLDNRHRENYMMVTFENMVSQPGKTFNSIADFLGIKFSKDVLDMTKFTDANGKKWTSNSSFEDYDSINAASICKWKEILSMSEIEVIEYFCQSELKLLGYRKIIKIPNVNHIKVFKEDSTLFCDWMKRYDFRYKLDNC